MKAKCSDMSKRAFTDAGENGTVRFETASGGTLFLDKVSNTTLPVQSKQIMRQHGGTNKLRSTPGEGTAITLLFLSVTCTLLNNNARQSSSGHYLLSFCCRLINRLVQYSRQKPSNQHPYLFHQVF